MSNAIYNQYIGHYNKYTGNDEHKIYRQNIAEHLLLNISLKKEPIKEYGAIDKKSEKLILTSTIFDVGCGNGDMLYIMQSMGYPNVSGIDLSENMCENAKKYNLRVECQNFDDYNIYNNYNNYDVVMAQAFIHLFPKADVSHKINKLITIANQKIYITTTQEPKSEE